EEKMMAVLCYTPWKCWRNSWLQALLPDRRQFGEAVSFLPFLPLSVSPSPPLLPSVLLLSSLPLFPALSLFPSFIYFPSSSRPQNIWVLFSPLERPIPQGLCPSRLLLTVFCTLGVDCSSSAQTHSFLSDSGFPESAPVYL
ncbi:hypothetical protein H1C71_028456, partial [Ictidomys tridecemlineatus]